MGYQPDVQKSAVLILPGPSTVMCHVVQIELMCPHGLKCNCAALKRLEVSLKLQTAGALMNHSLTCLDRSGRGHNEHPATFSIKQSTT